MLYFAILYFILISIFATIITIYDKKCAIKRKYRVKENTLLLISIFGGSFAMLITMKAIHHKTKHKKFMVGIPLIIFVQLIILYFIGRLFYA